MASTTYIDYTTPIVAAWLNDINTAVYTAIGNGTVAPTTPGAVRTNLGLTAVGGAALIGNTPAGNIAATNVQAALNELDAEKALLAGSASQAFATAALTTTTISATTVAATAISGTSLAVTGDINSASQNGGQLAGLRNKGINCNFAINQRAVSGTVTLAAGIYGHDRWKAGAGGCTYTFSTTLNITTLTISAGTLMQVIEGVNLQSGVHKLSWAGTALGRVDAGAYGATGVVGTAVGGTNQTIEFNTGTLSLVMYEPGAIATPFEHRPMLELALCKRYLPAFNDATGDIGNGVASSTSGGIITCYFDVEARVPPTGISGSAPATYSLTTGTAASAVTSIAFSNGAKRSGRISVAGTGTPYTANGGLVLTAAAAYQLLFTGCEL